MDRVKELEQKIGYVFKDKSLIERALMHSSYTNEKHLKKYECNERLEFWNWYQVLIYLMNFQRYLREN